MGFEIMIQMRGIKQTCTWTYSHSMTRHANTQATRALEDGKESKSKLQQEIEQLRSESSSLGSRLEQFEQNTPRLRDASRRLDVVQKDLDISQVSSRIPCCECTKARLCA
jgi:hypothetical protein